MNIIETKRRTLEALFEGEVTAPMTIVQGIDALVIARLAEARAVMAEGQSGEAFERSEADWHAVHDALSNEVRDHEETKAQLARVHPLLRRAAKVLEIAASDNGIWSTGDRLLARAVFIDLDAALAASPDSIQAALDSIVDDPPRTGRVKTTLAASPDNAKEGGDRNRTADRTDENIAAGSLQHADDKSPPVSEPAAQGRAQFKVGDRVTSQVRETGVVTHISNEHVYADFGTGPLPYHHSRLDRLGEPATHIPADLIEGLRRARTAIIEAKKQAERHQAFFTARTFADEIGDIDALLTKYGARQ